MWSSTKRALAAALVAAAIVTAAPARAQVTDPLEAVQALLDQRVAALASGDVGAWMATVDPRATADFLESQRTTFEGFRSVPVANLALTARTVDVGDLAPAGLAALRGADQAFVPETRLRYRIDGYEDRDTVRSLWLTYVRRGGVWYVAADDDLAAVGLLTEHDLWEDGPVVLVAEPDVLVVATPGREARARAVAALANEAIAVVRQRWPRPWVGRIVIVVPGSADQLEQLLQTTIDLDHFVAFVSYGADDERNDEATGARMYLQDENLSRHRRAFQLETLIHELVHAAASTLSGPFVPSWQHEGLADWIAVGKPLGQRAPASSDDHLPDESDFRTGSGASIKLAYDESATFMSWLAGAVGADAPVRLFEATGSHRSEPGTAVYWGAQAMRDVAGRSIAQAEEAWGG